ncbi:MAG TPA: cytochrome c oxidase subunit 3 [Gammaproteobacteria bacterium]|nr:cytochrome c oxidase subunit 3 [Gammaproteobacteria bacterium]
MSATSAEPRDLSRPLPIGSAGNLTPGWWGMVMLIATESAVFAYLFFSFYYLQSMADNVWPPSGKPPLPYALGTTGALFISVFTVWFASNGIRRGIKWRVWVGLPLTGLIGIAYVLLQLVDWSVEPFAFNSGAYSSLYYTITGFHLVHTIVGVLMIVAILLWTALGHVTSERCNSVRVVALYWYFLVVVWIGIMTTFYVLPYVTPR